MRVTEMASDIQKQLDSLEYSEQSIEALEQRLDLFYRLKQKYGPDIQAVMAYGEKARKELLNIYGVGIKVANCALLFGFGFYDAFPVDVWIKRIMEYCYFDGEQSIPAISAFAEKHFGDIGGFAQQYLFFYARENKIGTE